MDRERLLDILFAIGLRLRSPWVFGPVILFLSVYGLLFYNYLDQVEQRDKLTAQFDQLAGIAARSSALERLSERVAEFQKIQERIPPADLQEVDVFQAMWDLAGEVGLDRTSVAPRLTGESATETVGNTDYRVLSFSLEVTGDPDAVSEFVRRLDQGETPYGTLVLDKASFTFDETTRVSLNLKIYTRTGA